METSSNQDVAYLNAQLDVAFAMLNLAKLTRDYQTAQVRQNARHYYEAASDLLFRSTLEETERRQVRGRLEELGEWLTQAGEHLEIPDPAPLSG